MAKTTLRTIASGQFWITIVVALFLASCEKDSPPPYSNMRSHIVSKLSDDQIRNLYDEAKRKYEKSVAQAKKDEYDFWQQRQEKAIANEEKCKDIAFKTKNPNECNPPLPISVESIGKPLPGYESVEVIFERDLMGMCNFADTVRKAKEFGCLP